MKIPLYEALVLLFCLGVLVLATYQYWRGDIFGAIFTLERHLLIMLLVIFFEARIRRRSDDFKRD